MPFVKGMRFDSRKDMILVRASHRQKGSQEPFGSAVMIDEAVEAEAAGAGILDPDHGNVLM